MNSVGGVSKEGDEDKMDDGSNTPDGSPNSGATSNSISMS